MKAVDSEQWTVEKELIVKTCLLAVILLTWLTAAGQNPAPVSACDLTSLPADTPTRILQGSDPVPYEFACGVRGSGTCIASKLDPGLIVITGPEQSGWTCVSDGDATFGWVPTSRLASVPSRPAVPLSMWIGWWHQGKPMPGVKDNRLLITPGNSQGTLNISGRAYWYGSAGVVHFGEVNAEATPVGRYLHVVEGDDLSGCVLDFAYDLAAHSIAAHDNARCGGMNARFWGIWTRFSPSPKKISESGRR